MSELSFATLNHSPLVEPHTDLRAQVAAAADAGYPMVSPDVFSVRAHLAEGRSLAELADVLADRQLRCLDLAGLTLSANEGRTKRGAEELLDVARALGSDWVQLRVIDAVDDRIAGLLAWCSDVFGGAGVGLALEFSPLTAVKTIADARDLLRAAVGHGARTGVIVDTCHFFRGDDRWSDLRDLPLAELAFVQFSDGMRPSGDPGRDTLHRRALPGEGEFDLDEFASCLREKGFGGAVSVEVLSEALRRLRVDEFARRTFEASLPYWR